MTAQESELAFDLIDMYAVLPLHYGVNKFYSKKNRVKVGSYNSDDVKPLNKEAVKKLLIDDGLI